MEQKNYAEAEKLFRECLEIQKKARGEEHPQVGNALVNLAMALAKQPRTAPDARRLALRANREARRLGKQALAIFEATEPDSFMTARCREAWGEEE